jgi:hypothetical protein
LYREVKVFNSQFLILNNTPKLLNLKQDILAVRAGYPLQVRSKQSLKHKPETSFLWSLFQALF